MATKISITAPTKAGKTVKVWAQRQDDNVCVWIAGGGIVGDYPFERFGGSLTASSLRAVLFGN